LRLPTTLVCTAGALKPSTRALTAKALRCWWLSLKLVRRACWSGACCPLSTLFAGSFVGGYNPKGWLGYGDWRDAISAFLFARNQVGGAKFVKVPKVGGSGMAIIDEQGGGPCWGPDGLKIDLEKRVARSRLGSYYAKLPNGDRTLFSDKEGQTARLTAVRVYVGLGETEKAASYKPVSCAAVLSRDVPARSVSLSAVRAAVAAWRAGVDSRARLISDGHSSRIQRRHGVL